MSTQKFAPPEPRIIYSMANQPLTWWKALAEWIDNALDAGAQTISIEFDGRGIVVRDDGGGAIDPVAMIVPGHHAKQTGTIQGIFGVGGKDAALWVGGISSNVAITTTRDGVCRCIEVYWSEYIKDSSYREHDERPGGASGTEIAISPLFRQPPNGKDWAKLLEQLGYVYTPPLGRGVQIKLKRPRGTWQPLVPWKAPALQGDIVDLDIEITDKLRAHIYCGVVQTGVLNPRSGFTYFHGNRVIEASSENGCGRYRPHRIHGRVDLVGYGWPRTKNKDALNADAPTVAALYERIAEVCDAVLARGDSIGAEIASEHFLAAVNDRLQQSVSADRNERKAKRSKPSNGVIGTVLPTGSGSSHGRAANEQSGTRFRAARKEATVRLAYDHLGGSRIGKVQGKSITLNLDNSLVVRAKDDLNVDATVLAALSLLSADHCYAPTGQTVLRGFDPGQSVEDYSVILGELLSKISFDGTPVGQPRAGAA